jgi:hypothetical protein
MRNVYLTKSQAYSYETNPSSRQRGCYIRTITARVQLKKTLVVGLKGLDAKTNWLAVSRQSGSNSDSELAAVGVQQRVREWELSHLSVEDSHGKLVVEEE